MRKKLFAVIMSIMMMVTFMPAMAFAADTPADPSMTMSATVITAEKIVVDANNYGVNQSTGLVKNFSAESGKGFTATVTSPLGKGGNTYVLKGSTIDGVALYATIGATTDGWTAGQWYDLSVGCPALDFSGAGVSYELQIVPVVKTAGIPFCTMKFTFGDDNKEVKYGDPSTAEAMIGDVYYGTYEEAMAAVQNGETIKVLGDVDVQTIGNGTKTYTVDLTSADAQSMDITVKKGSTLKNADLGDCDLTLEENATAENVGNVDELNVVGKNVKVVSADAESIYSGYTGQASSVTITGNLYFEFIEVGYSSSVNIAGATLSDEVDSDAYFYVYPSGNVTLTDDERWTKEEESGYTYYKLNGVVVYNGKTYSNDYGLEDLEAAMSADSNPTIKFIGKTGSELDLVANQTLTITGTYNSNYFGHINKAAAGSKVVVKSGRFGEEFDVVTVADSQISEKEMIELVGEESGISVARTATNVELEYDGGDFVVGNDIILKALNKGKVVGLLVLGTDMTEEDLYEAKVSGKTGLVVIPHFLDNLSLVGPVCPAWTKVMSTKHSINPRLFMDVEDVYRTDAYYSGIINLDNYYYLLTEAEYYDYSANFVPASHEMQVANVKASVSGTTVKLTSDVAGVFYEVNGEVISGNTLTLKAGSVNSLKVRAFKLVAGKLPVYSKAVKLTAKTAPTVKAAKKALKVSYGKQTGAKKYQISVSTKKNGTKVKVTTKKTSYTVKKLAAKKTYYVKVRIVKSNGSKGSWSAVKKIKTK